MEQHEDTEHTPENIEDGPLEVEAVQSEPEAIPLGPDTQAIIIQSIN